ncbi:hypothetical protein KAU33_06020, partial [Candidatus Dependentiae bacterium]|nr:hypothetical protein [Candidatus Dependentiae bacterium]
MSEEKLSNNNIKNSDNSFILDKRLFKENSYIREIILFLMIIGLVYFSTLFYGGVGETGQFIRLLFISVIIVLSFRNLVFSGKTIEWFKRNTILFLWIIFFFGYLIFQFFYASVNKFASLKSLFALFYSVVFFAALLNFNWEKLRFKFFKAIIFWGFFQAVLVIIQKIFLVANSGGTPLNPIILNTIIFKTLGIVGTAGTFFNPNFMVDFL